jgi:hypothetical protein
MACTIGRAPEIENSRALPSIRSASDAATARPVAVAAGAIDNG